MSPLVSIVITSYNKAQYLEQAVKSVLSQTYPHIECIIVNDGSTDNTDAIARQIVSSHPQVQYYAKPNGGVSSARNFGVTKVTGEWLQFLDADDWINENKIRFQLDCLQQYADQKVVAYADYERVYVDKEEKIVKCQTHQVGNLSKQQLVDRLLICPDFLADSPFPLLQQAMLFKTSLFKNHHFETSLKACEDRELVLLLLMEDIPFIYTPIIGAYYRKHAANMTDDAPLMQESYVGYFEMVKQKHGDKITLYPPSINLLIDKIVAEKDSNSLQRILQFIDFPVYILQNKLRFSNVSALRIFYALRLITPNFILYEKSRGPRSQKLLAMLKKVFKLPKLFNSYGKTGER